MATEVVPHNETVEAGLTPEQRTDLNERLHKAGRPPGARLPEELRLMTMLRRYLARYQYARSIGHGPIGALNADHRWRSFWSKRRL